MQNLDDVELIRDTVLSLERGALDRWANGDPGGHLELAADDVTYFDPYVKQRLDGIDELKAWYESIWGKIQIDQSEIIDPDIDVVGNAAILTFQYLSQGSEGVTRWNCTEVYRFDGSDWEIAHSHWSLGQDPDSQD